VNEVAYALRLLAALLEAGTIPLGPAPSHAERQKVFFKVLLEQLGCTQYKELAWQLGISSPQLSVLATGKKDVFTSSRYNKIIELLAKKGLSHLLDLLQP
jgi:DNA-binding Xre family transcriptional regulator